MDMADVMGHMPAMARNITTIKAFNQLDHQALGITGRHKN